MKFIRRFIILLICIALSFGCALALQYIVELQIAYRINMLKAMLEDGVRSNSFLILQAITIGTSLAIVITNKITVRVNLLKITPEIGLLRFTVPQEKHDMRGGEDISNV